MYGQSVNREDGHGGGMDRSLQPRALVADDSEDIRFLVSRLVRKVAPGASVDVVHDGAQALAALEDAGDGEDLLVISDYDMGPGITGTQLLARVAESSPRARRILFTGMEPEGIEQCGAAPDAIISKLGGLAHLRRELDAWRRECLSRERRVGVSWPPS
ncbi:MAG: hypothetical protein QOE90_2421 [Thermoplasmata archaeon]|jgi:CheY-like chemotaxis protein|nr:hypothetical protein [Thermoplasmata archaeon]